MNAPLASTVADLIELTLSRHDALALLQRWLATGFDTALARRAADYAAALPGRQPLGDWVGQLGRVELDEDGPEPALARLVALQGDLNLAQELELVRLIAARMETLDPMVGVVDRMARDAIAEGDFGAATALLGLLAKAEAGEAGARLESALRRALEQTEAVREYQRVHMRWRRKRAAKLADGKTLILVGGPKEVPEHVARLKKNLGFGNIEWLPCEPEKKPPLAKLAMAHSASHVVIILTDYIGHSTSEAAARACGSRISPILCAKRGIDTMEQAIVDRLAPTS